MALLLMALIAVVLVGALRLSTQTWSKVIEKQDQSEHRFLVTQLLRRHIGNMRFLRVRNEQGEAMTSFLGGTEQLAFLATFPSFDNDGALYLWSLKNAWNEDNNRFELVMDYVAYAPGASVLIDVDGGFSYEKQLPSRLLVADNMLLSGLQYYSRDPQGVESWEDRWEPSMATPLVVRFTLTELDAGGNKITLPEIAVAPRFGDQQLHAGAVEQR